MTSYLYIKRRKIIASPICEHFVATRVVVSFTRPVSDLSSVPCCVVGSL